MPALAALSVGVPAVGEGFAAYSVKERLLSAGVCGLVMSDVPLDTTSSAMFLLNESARSAALLYNKYFKKWGYRLEFLDQRN